MRPVPLAVLTLVHEFEGNQGRFEPTRTQDPVGNWEIGWSHKLSGPADPLWSANLSADSADNIAMQDMSAAAQAVCKLCGQQTMALLSDNQYAALIDFTYNEGVGHFAGSTLLKKVKAGDKIGASYEFVKWVYAGGEVLNGLIRRRAAEKALWLA